MTSPENTVSDKTPPLAWALVVAGGVGVRFCAPHSHHPDKLLATLGGTPLLVRTMEAFAKAHTIEGIILVAHPDKRVRYNEILHQYGIQKPLHVVDGGESRRASVYNGLCAMQTLSNPRMVAVHDAARPLIDPECIDRAVSKLAHSETAQGVVVGIPIHDTVKRVDSEGSIIQTEDRRSLWRAQTPQVFWLNALKRAHETASADLSVTDDSQLIEMTGTGPVETLLGSEFNLKITTPEDLLTAESWLHRHQHPHEVHHR
ncbi:MAG: 2-C-methyl-D-erythritol 4-phosphate cytidylyltransferase [Cyanobacteria bacterium]|nr:2-C-methyl-D-erythritol 4-phosphate cytidylyltransferase [Cyanobacteriota bacterium]